MQQMDEDEYEELFGQLDQYDLRVLKTAQREDGVLHLDNLGQVISYTSGAEKDKLEAAVDHCVEHGLLARIQASSVELTTDGRAFLDANRKHGWK